MNIEVVAFTVSEKSINTISTLTVILYKIEWNVQNMKPVPKN